MSLDQYPAWPDLLRWLNLVKDRVENIVAVSAEQVITGEFDPSLIPPIPWDRVLKAGSSLGDLETTSAGDLTSGTLPDARMPALTGDVSSVVGTVATTLATVNTHPGTYGAGMTIPLISVNAKGLVTDIVDYPIAGSPFTPGSVIFAGALGQFAQDNAQLFWDDANLYLGIGTATPARLVHAESADDANLLVSTTSTDTWARIFARSGSLEALSLKQFGSGAGGTTSGITNVRLSHLDGSGDNLLISSALGSIIFSNGTIETARITNAGLVGIGLAPTAILTLKAGTTAASTAPLKFTSGSLLTSAEAGAVEFLTDAFYGTITTGAARKQFLFTDGSITGLTGTLGVTHGGTGTPTAFTAGSVVFAGASGVYSQDNANLFWDDTNNRLGVGTVTPATTLHVSAATNALLALTNTNVNGHDWGLYVMDTGASANGNLLIFDRTSSVRRATFRTDGSVGLGGSIGNDAGVGAILSLDYPSNNVGISNVAPTARLHLPAGTATANTAPLKFTSGTLLTTAEAGAIEFLTDAYYGTITTGAARKQFVMNDGTAFTLGSIPFATTGGMLTEANANWFYDATNNRVGINTTSPGAPLEIKGSSAGFGGGFRLKSSANSNYWDLVTGGSNTLYFGYNGGQSVNFETSGGITTLAGYTTLNGLRISGADVANTIYQGTGDLSITASSGNKIYLSLVNSSATGLTVNTTSGNVGIGTTGPTAVLHLKAGTATANTAPFKFTSGPNLTTAEAGAMEYDGTDLFFTRAGTVRENVLVAIDNVAAPGTSIGVGIVNYYGTAATNFLGDPNRWLSVNVLGATYKIPLYT